MHENLAHEGSFNTTFILNRVGSSNPSEIIGIAAEASSIIRDDRILAPGQLIKGVQEQLQGTTSLDQQALLLTFAFLLEGKTQLHKQTDGFLSDLASAHQYKGVFTQPFQKFISERLRIANSPRTRRSIEDGDGTRKILELLMVNEDFFHDIMDLQSHFSDHVSPVMPLNATWNPLLTDLYKVKGVEGLWYIYSNNKREEYTSIMKQQMSSEWTGFNRFASEKWDQVRQAINVNGNLVDIGSSIGISAFEIARELGMQSSIILVDSHNPLRMTTPLRIIDYANPDKRFIPLTDALAQLDELRDNRVLIALFGVDFSIPLSPDISNTVANAAIVHCANIFPYLPKSRFYQFIRNSIEATSSQGGVLKFHNDDSLPIDNILRSIVLQRNGNTLAVLANSAKGRFDL